MSDKSDAQLLSDYAEQRNESAFSEIVARHTDLVYSAALRQVASAHLARDITQSVFSDLARKAGPLAGKLPPNASLVGWLYRSIRFAALNQLRDDRRRLTHERQAMEQLLANSEPAPDWERICPIFDEAMEALKEEDREALLLRYFKNQELRAVGLALGVSEDAAQKRVSRAVERLREFFAKRGVAVGAGGLAAVIAGNAVQAAPVGLAATISTAAIIGAGLTSTATVTTTKVIAMTTLQKAIIGATLTIFTGAGIYEAHRASRFRDQAQTLRQQQSPMAEEIQQLRRERDDATNRLAAMNQEMLKNEGEKSELLRLRGEVGALREEQKHLRKSLAALNGAFYESTNALTQAGTQNVIPKKYWAFVGYGTPEAALQSMMWAMSQGNVESFLTSLGPEAQQLTKQQFEEQSDAEISAWLTNEALGVAALRLDRKQVLSDGSVTFVVHSAQQDNGASVMKDDAVLKFKNVNGEWKCDDPP